MKYKETIAYSIINSKCPQCHEGDFFETNNPYNLKKFDKMDRTDKNSKLKQSIMYGINVFNKTDLDKELRFSFVPKKKRPMYFSEKVEQHLPKLNETMSKITKSGSD